MAVFCSTSIPPLKCVRSCAGGFALRQRECTGRWSFCRRNKSSRSQPRVPNTSMDGASATDVVPSNGTESSTAAGAVFSVEMCVRDSELDQYSVVNNAVYASYFQHARHEWFAYMGLDADEVARSGRALAASRLSIQYLAPLKSRDKFRSTVYLKRMSGARIVLHQEILKLSRTDEEQEQVVAIGEVEIVSLNESYKPIRISKEDRDAVSKFINGDDVIVMG